MAKRVVPMIHVPDVRATVDWYGKIGFDVVATYGNESDDGLSFAIVAFGETQVMFNQDGKPSDQWRREVDLYVYTDDVDEVYTRLRDLVDVVESPHNTFYGMREIIIRDVNRFWITFGQESVFGLLIGGISEAKPELVRRAIKSGRLKAETLNVALAAALVKGNDEIVELLKQAGATPPPHISLATLESYTGKYRGENGPAFEIMIKDGRLFAAPGAHEPISLWPLDQRTFKPIAFDGATIIFNAEEGRTVGLTFIQDGHYNELQRVATNDADEDPI